MEVTISLPAKHFVADSPERVAAKIRLYAALGMYQTGELSIGAACEVAGVDRFVFLALLRREGIPPKPKPLLNWKQSTDG